MLSQTIREWSFEAEVPLRPFAVCSDARVSRQQTQGDDNDMATHDLALPATTDSDRLIRQMASVEESAAGLIVVLSTYQSISTIAEAQQKGLPRFDLIDGNTADGLRKSLIDEFDIIYCYNLRGNQRTAGELSRKEGGKVFDSGSRNTVAILILLKTSDASGQCVLHYRDIGDYLTRSEKLRTLAGQDLETVPWEILKPNSEGDWINQQDDRFGTFQSIAERDKSKRSKAVFQAYSGGLKTNRDAWVYNFSKTQLEENTRSMIEFYNEQVESFGHHCGKHGITAPTTADVEKFIDLNPKKISWSSGLIPKVARSKRIEFDASRVTRVAYRPFCQQWIYFDQAVNDRAGRLPDIFPEVSTKSLVFYNVGNGSVVPFSVIMLDSLPDLHLTGAGSGGQFFPRYTYREVDGHGDLFTVSSDSATCYERIDNITDSTLLDFRTTYNDEKISKDDIFFYTYGLLHSVEYRELFTADLKKSLPRIPRVRNFHEYSKAGSRLPGLHVNYEHVTPYAGIVEDVNGSPLASNDLFRVTKMKFGRAKGKPDRSTIIYNSHVAVTNIPEEAYRYQLGARSAIEWIIDRYQIRADKPSGIVNDPNDWSSDPRYIIDLLKRIVTVSLETMKIVDNLPPLDIVE